MLTKLRLFQSIQAIYTFAQSEPSRSKPSKHLQIYVSQAVFDWDHPQAVYMLKKNNEMHSLGNRQDFTLNVDEMFVPKVCADGADYLAFSLLHFTNIYLIVESNHRHYRSFAVGQNIIVLCHSRPHETAER